VQELAHILRQRILHEIQGRGWSFTVPQIPCALIFVLFIPGMYQENLIFLLGTISVALGSIVFSIPTLKIASSKRDPENFYLAGTAFVSLGWSIVLAAFFHQHGMMAPVSLLTVVVVCGVNAGAFILLTPHKKLFYTYFLPMIFIPSICALWVIHNLEDFTLLVLMAIYNLFLMFSAPPIRQRFQSSILNELRLAQEKDKIEALMDAFPGIVSVIDENHSYQMMNRFGHDMLGRTDVVGQPLGFITPEDEFVRVVRDFINRRELPRLTQEMRVNTGNGVHWFLVSMSRLHHPSGWVVVVSVLIDELVDARNIAEEQKTKAGHTSRMASLGEMAQGIAHEINNPLAVIMFSADEILQRSKRNELEHNFVENFSGKILAMSKRIAKIVKGLRYFSRDAEQDPFRVVPVSVILEQTIDFRMEKCKSNGINLEILPYDETLLVNCREVQIMQALVNLLNNSFDAVVGLPDPWIRLEVRETENKIQVVISDSGDEISLASREKMFEPFFTTKEVGQGTGLGLSIALGLLQGNHGDLKYLGGHPTRFEISLPKAH
jgi:signal transduction histidine kinase